MDFLNILGSSGDRIQRTGIQGAVSSRGSKLNLPQSVISSINSLINRLDGKQLDQFTDAHKNFRTGEYKDALIQFSSLAQEFPKEGVLQWFQGAMNMIEGNIEQAQTGLQRAQELNSDLPDFSSILNMFK